ncbi:MAG TPA: metallophosphoesterase [Chitinophagaceae bacterium]|nr:metallophosphoesterase [Chitinophagaceae bacterium]
MLRFTGKALRFLLKKPVTRLAARVSSAPDKNAVLEALTELYEEAGKPKSKKLKRIDLEAVGHRIIIFSDQHRGTRDGADDFAVCEACYLKALEYYNSEQFYFINLGDCEELWENSLFGIVKHNEEVFAKEKLFITRDAYCKVFGNHDLFWDNDPLAPVWLKKIYGGKAIRIYTGVLIRVDCSAKSKLEIFCTHGHQGDKQSDGNWFSKWFVSYIWGPLQKLLEININSPSANDNLKTLHNRYMYDWSAAQENILLVTGHTHQPVFNSLTHLERLYQQLEKARTLNDRDTLKKIEAEIPRRKREYNFVNQSFGEMKPTYFNSGCCCFEDGTITGIEIYDGLIRLVKWSLVNGKPERIVAEEESLKSLARKLAIIVG